MFTFIFQSLATQTFFNDLYAFPQSSERVCESCAMKTLDNLGATDAKSQNEPVIGHSCQALAGHCNHRGNPGADLHDPCAQCDVFCNRC